MRSLIAHVNFLNVSNVLDTLKEHVTWASLRNNLLNLLSTLPTRISSEKLFVPESSLPFNTDFLDP